MSKCEKRCEDCIHCDLCLNIHRLILFDKNQVAHCKAFKDKSLFVEVPCKIGDTVYLLMGSTTPIEAFVSSVEFFYNWVSKKTETHLELRIFKNFPVHKRVEDFGITIFLTKEEAERKLEVGE